MGTMFQVTLQIMRPDMFVSWGKWAPPDRLRVRAQRGTYHPRTGRKHICGTTGRDVFVQGPMRIYLL